MAIISYPNKLAKFSKYRSSCVSPKDSGSVRADWIWIRPNLQWSLETPSLSPPTPPHSGIFQIRCHPLSSEATWRRTDPRIQHQGFLARMPMRHITKAGNRTTVQSSSSISMEMIKFRAEQGVLSWIGRTGTLGAK